MVDVRYTTAFELYPYQHHVDQDASHPQRHSVVIVGGAPVGMAMALDLGRKGVVWNVGRVFHGEREVFDFNLSPEEGLRNPALVNLQQLYFEKFLVDQIRIEQERGAPIEIRGCNQVTGLSEHADYVSLDIDTPNSAYSLEIG